MTPKEQALTYYRQKCIEHDFDADLYDIEAELDSTLSLGELKAQIDSFFGNRAKEITRSTIQAMHDEEIERTKSIQRATEAKQSGNFKLLSQSAAIWITGKRGSGKTAMAYGLCKQMQPFKRIYWYKFPRTELLKAQHWENLNNLHELSRMTDSVVVIDEASRLLRGGSYQKRNNTELEQILTIARQNDLTIIIISQQSQVVTKSMEALIDCFIVLDIDYSTLKNGSKVKQMIKNASVFDAEHFTIERGTFLYASRDYPVFSRSEPVKYPIPEGYNKEWSTAYKNTASTNKPSVEPLGEITW